MVEHQHKTVEASHEFDMLPVPPKPHVIHISPSGDASIGMLALTSDGRIFKYIRDPSPMSMPGSPPFMWAEIKGPV
jgi:hypothetical protein